MSTKEADSVCIILDTSAIIRSSALRFSGSKKVYTTPSTLLEMEKSEMKILEAILLMKEGRLVVKSAERDAMLVAVKFAKRTGDIRNLSDADMDVIAVAIDLRNEGEHPLVLTSDYAIQNVLSFLKIPFKSVGLRNIRTSINWRNFCPSCGRKHPGTTFCSTCGTRLVTKRAATRHD